MIEQLTGALGILLYPVALALLLLPGFAVALRFAASRPISRAQLLILILTLSCTVGYVSFWAFFASRPLGKAFSFACTFAAAASLLLDWRRYSDLRLRSVFTPFLYVLGVGTFYLCLFYLFSNPMQVGAELSEQRFFSATRPGDQIIPLIFADKVYNRESMHPFCCGDWLSSDRPPLQAGLFLFQRPLRLLGSPGFNYQLLGAGLQCLWLCGVWALLVSLGASAIRIRQVLGFLVFSGFMLFNSVYPWPKLLAATFILFALSILFEVLRENRPISTFQTALAALSLSLALLSHPGSVFSLPAFAPIVAWKFKLFPLRQCALFMVILAGFLMPWKVYQTFYDPPGNRLVKIHIAGVISIDNRPTWQTIREAYGAQKFSTILEFKWSNLARLIGPEPLNKPSLHRAAVEQTRIAQREYIWNAIGILNFGWLALAVLAIRRKGPVIPYSGWLLAASVLNLVLFALILFGPAGTMTTHSSYADILLISVALAGYFLALPRSILLIGFALQIFDLFVIWVWTPPISLHLPITAALLPSIQVPQAIVALAFTGILAWHFGRSYFEPSKDDSFSR